jgi:hypothetical protein
VGLKRGLLSLVSTIESYLEEKLVASVQKTENTAVMIRCASKPDSNHNMPDLSPLNVILFHHN